MTGRLHCRIIIRVNETQPHIVFTETFSEPTLEKARRAGRVTVLSRPNREALLSAAGQCDALVIRTRTQVTAEIIEAAPKLRVIGRAGVGLDNVDVAAAQRRGVALVYTPAAATEAVADLTVGLMLAVVRRLAWYDGMVRRGRFDELRQVALRELGDLTVGIVGMGRIGQAAARRCHFGFGCPIIYNDVVEIAGLDFAAAAMSKSELFAHADIISLHVPLTEATRGMIDAAALDGFKPGAVLINTSRGEVVDSHAVSKALHSGHLGGAGVDVLEREPPPPDHPLLIAPNVVLTPHVGARTHRGLANMESVIDDVLRVLRGEAPFHSAK